jgi:RNA polymerase sigma-70 factor (ECF subfamily)
MCHSQRGGECCRGSDVASATRSDCESGQDTATAATSTASKCPHTIEAALPSLIAFARRLGIGNPEAERDLVQDSIVRALSAGIGREVCIKAWLGTILRNLHIDRFRRRASEPAHLSFDEAGSALFEVASCSSTSGRVEVSQTLTALAALPDELRGPFERYAIQGSTYREIGDEYGLSLATVGTRLRRARAKLKEQLDRT